MANKRKRSKKNISDSSGHSKSLNDIAQPLAEEANKTVKIIIYVLLTLATFAIYSQVQDHEFIHYDDDLFITNNLNVQAGLTSESISWAFTTLTTGNWYPVTWFSHILDYQLYGLNAKGHHLTSLFFHIANSLLLFLVLFRMTGAIWQSAFVASIFAFHPLNVDSVAWISERKNVLSTFFWLLTMWAYIRYAEKSTIKKYGLVLLFFALGLMSKSMLVTLPFVLLLLDYWPLGRLKLEQERGDKKITEKHRGKKSETLRLVLEKIPLFLLTAGLSIVTFLSQKIGWTVQSQDLLSLQARLTNAMVSYLEYLGKMIWPEKLAIFYSHPGNALAVWQGILCGMVLVSITIISIRLIRKAPYFAVGWFWYLGTLVPVIGIVQVGNQAMADRYAYVPLIGIFIIVAWGVPELISKWRYKEKVLSISVGIIIFTLLITTWRQVSHWKNNITIFKHAIRVTDKKYPSFALVHNNLGIALVAKQKNEEAISHYKMAIKLKPDYASAYNNLGAVLFAKQKNEEAISHYKMAIKLNPDLAKAHNNLGVTLVAEGKIEEAISHYKMAIRLKPGFAVAHYNLGITLVAEGKNEEAISHYKMAIKANPDYADAHYNLGVLLFNEKMTEEAIDYFKEAIRIRPGFAVAHYNLGITLVAEGKIEEAISHYKMAIKANPDFAVAHYNLGITLAAEGKNEEAISHYKMAIKANPDYAKPYNNLGNILVAERKIEEAISQYKMAIKLNPDYAIAHNNLGEALFAEQKIEEAITHYKVAIKLNPDYAAAHNNLETALSRLEKQ
jgi:tetratricopeptide (TPR) repeat protein